ncbi:hypothetical protein GCT13_24990 [Paraburkholderia sp. CNPSo 3157]|uniref:Uncharacterized protein n=1 Tax=Paraburkholderia franconis TaxID=2654983 RepID=A0A7X1NDM9_9BURK|nr:hypothetical protein [Paraburkholderia franconis]MPW20058.1 hypothetical protein [Paraburkholderia franconis]
MNADKPRNDVPLDAMVDMLTGQLAVYESMLFALIATHERPHILERTFEGISESATANALPLEVSEMTLEAQHEFQLRLAGVLGSALKRRADLGHRQPRPASANDSEQNARNK